MSYEAEIRSLLAEFCHALDERRFSDWSSLYTRDGIFSTPRLRVEGRAEILRMISGAELATVPDLRRKHTVHNILVKITDDTADVECDLVQIDKRGDAPYRIVLGRYRNSVILEDGGAWRFTHVHVETVPKAKDS